MSQKAVIYWGSGSIPCWKALIVLEEKGIEYESKLISFSKQEHKGEDVKKHNQRGQVPTFIDADGTNVNESNAICFYLEQKNKNNPLIPTKAEEYAKVLQRSFEASENMQNKLGLGIISKLFTKKESRGVNFGDEMKKGKENLVTELGEWEKYLGKTKYAATDNFTMADVFFFPFIAWTQRLSLNLDKFPNIKAYYGRVMERPSIKNTLPPHWKDPPTESGKEMREALKDL